MKTKQLSLSELKIFIGKTIKEGFEDSNKIDKIMSSLNNINNDEDLYYICYAIAPKSVAREWDRNQLLDTMNDVLHSRF